MKSFIIVFVIGFSFNATANIALAPEKVEALKNACAAAALHNHTKVHSLKEGCACLVGKISEMAAHENNTGDAEMDLDWATRFYNHKMKQEEVEADRLGIVDRLFEFGGECLRNN